MAKKDVQKNAPFVAARRFVKMFGLHRLLRRLWNKQVRHLFRETQSLRTSAEIVRQVNVKYSCQWFIYLIMPACCFSAVTYLIFTASPEILRIKYRKDFASAINVSLRAMLACDRPATPSSSQSSGSTMTSRSV